MCLSLVIVSTCSWMWHILPKFKWQLVFSLRLLWKPLGLFVSFFTSLLLAVSSVAPPEEKLKLRFCYLLLNRSEFPHLVSQGSWGTKNTHVKAAPVASLGRQKSVGGRPAEHSLSSSPATTQSSVKGKRDTMSKHSGKVLQAVHLYLSRIVVFILIPSCFYSFQRPWSSELGVRVKVLDLSGRNASMFIFLLFPWHLFARILIFIKIHFKQHGNKHLLQLNKYAFYRFYSSHSKDCTILQAYI